MLAFGRPMLGALNGGFLVTYNNYVIEAEDMHLNNFKVGYGANASGNKLVRLSSFGADASLSTAFGGESGTYDLTIRAQDENDGQSKIIVFINGVQQEMLILDGDNNGVGSNHGHFSDFKLEGLEINHGDVVDIRVWGDKGELVRIDNLTFDEVEAPNTAPTFDNLPANGVLHLDENQTAVIDADASDADGDALTYEIVGGVDAALFEIDAHTGALSFKNAPDFENPTDSNGNNVYDVTIKVSDGNGGSDTKAMWVKVADVDENAAPEMIMIEAEDMHEAGFHVFHGANASGGEGIRLDYFGGNGDVFTDFTGDGGTYDITIRAQDENDGQSMIKVSVNGVQVGVITLDNDNNGGGSNNGGFQDFVLEGVEINPGDRVSFWVDGDAGELVRLDKFTFTSSAGPVDPEPLGSIGGTYFMDNNDNSVQDAGDMAIANATVWLLLDGAQVGMTTTDADGNYLFEGLDAGNYSVRFDEQDGKAFVEGNVGNDDTIDSDVNNVGTAGNGNVEGIVLGQGENIRNVDAGVEVVDTATASLAGRIFMDTDGDAQDNNNGDEMGVAGVTVTLTDAAGNFIDETVTAADGSYEFTNLPAGEYKVDFPTEVDGKVLVQEGQGPDTQDSDANQATGETGTIVLGIGDNVVDVDAGLETPEVVDPGTASLGNQVFLDANGNGRRDNGEVGVGGVEVTLTGAGEDGVFGTADDITATATTSTNGFYRFGGLDAGDYKVTFDASSTGLDFTTAGTGSATASGRDSDADQITGMTGVISLAIGERTSRVDAGLVDNSPEVADDDAGAICADTPVTVDVLSNDDAGLVITQVAGQDIAEGETVDVNGVQVTLTNGELVIDGKDAFEDLDIGEQADVAISYTVSDDAGREATADVNVTFKGVAETLDELFASLPTTGTYQVIVDDTPPVGEEAFDVRIDGTGDARFDGVVFSQAYCLSLFDPADTGLLFGDAPIHTADVLNGKDTSLFNADQISFANGETAGDNMDLINWIINQDFANDGSGQFSEWEIQRAIWELTDAFDTVNLDDIEGYGTDADVNAIVDLAIANGEGFMAGQGDLATMIVDPNPNTAENAQPFIVAFSFDDNDCIC